MRFQPFPHMRYGAHLKHVAYLQPCMLWFRSLPHTTIDPMTQSRPHSQHALRAHFALVQNIRALIAARNVNGSDVAQAAGHKPPWLSKILSSDRGMRLQDLDKIAAFFDIEVCDLFRPGIAQLLERRRGMPDRRIGRADRRLGGERR